MVEEARLGAHAVAPPRLHLPGAAAGRDRARGGRGRSRPARRGHRGGVARRSARRGRRARRPLARRRARRQGDISHEAEALSLRMRIAFDLGDLAAHGRAHGGAHRHDRPAARDEERAMAMACVAQSYMLRDLVEPTCEWADKALALADGQRLRDRAPGGDGGEGLGARDRAGHRRRGRGPPAGSRRRGRAHRRPCPGRPGAGQPRVAGPHVEPLRRGTRARPAHAPARRRRPGSTRWPATHASRPLAALAAADGDLDSALDVLDRGRRVRPRARASRATAAGWPCCGPGSPSRPATWRRPRVHRGGQARDRPQSGSASWGSMPTWPPAREICLEPGNGSPSCWPSSPRRATHRRPRCTTSWRPSLRAGLDPAELRPFVEAAGIFPGNRLPADHPLRQLLDAQLAEAEGRTEEAAALYAAAAALGRDQRHAGPTPRHRPGRGRALPDRPRVDWTRRAPTPRPPPSTWLAGTVGGSTSSKPCSGGSASDPS